MAHEQLERRLAAIVAADIVGYSRLMQQDEAGTLMRQKAIQDELIDPKVKELGGRVVKTTGDGLLIEFPSAVNAVLCAVAVQREMAAREADNPEHTRIRYRVGINLGEIIHDGEDIFGDGVNVTARLEASANPGGIRISEAVYNNVKGKLDLGFANLGPQKVKNIAEPISTYEVLLDPEDVGKLIEEKREQGLSKWAVGTVAITLVVFAFAGYFGWEQFRPAGQVTPEIPRLLVLPFQAETDDAELFADGATENFISSFAILKEMTVIPRSVSIEYKGIDPRLDQLTKRHGFQYVLDGLVRRDDDNLEITVRLRRAPTGILIWEQSAQGSTGQAFDLFAKLKTRTTASMKVPLNEKERELLTAVPTGSMRAYLRYAEGFRHENSGEPTEHLEAYKAYAKAIEIDPNYLEAMVAYARVNRTIWFQSWNIVRPAIDARDDAAAAIMHILDRHPDQPDALGLQITMQLAMLQRQQALTAARTAVFKHPKHPNLRWALATALAATGEYEAAIAELDHHVRLSPRLSPEHIWGLSLEYNNLGESEKALRLLDTVTEPHSRAPWQIYHLAVTHARMGNYDTARTYLDTMVKSWWPQGSLAWLKPKFQIYQDDHIYKQFASAMRRIGLPEWPYSLDIKHKKNRVNYEKLKIIFGKPVDMVNAFGGVLRFKPNGTYSAANIKTPGEWRISDDKVCLKNPSIFTGIEWCELCFRDPENDKPGMRAYFALGPTGPTKFFVSDERVSSPAD